MQNRREKEWPYWLALKMVRGVGNVGYKDLLSRFGSPPQVFAARMEDLLASGLQPEVARAIGDFRQWDRVQSEVQNLQRLDLRLVTVVDEEYPRLLQQIHDPPPFLFVKGALLPEDRLAVAVVGSRMASSYGREITRHLAGELAGRGITIVSGLALGIDAEAHSAALEAGGRTIAVMGSGMDIIYPKENRSLYEAIPGGGAVVSEFFLGTRPEAVNFPYRNRVISGMCAGVIIIEATEKSGSLITAHLALEQGRDVFAVPGNVTSSRSRGTNRLIKEGAKLVEGVEDILAEIAPAFLSPRPSPSSPPVQVEAEEAHILRLFAGDRLHIDTVIQRSGLSAAKVLEVLLTLEIKGLIRQLPGKHFSPRG